MYPSTTNHGNYSLTRITLQPETCSSLYDCNNDINLSQEHYHPPSSSPFQLLSPHVITFGDGTILSEFLQGSVSSDDRRHQNTNTVVHEQQNNLECSNNNGKVVTKYGDDDAENKTIRRTSKKDRHSKINTAQGPRDRRMRLSVEVAKKFFKLQDMLGFDKASETVEWLLMKSNSCIQELLPHQQLIHRSSKCDQVLSRNIDDQCMVNSSSSSNRKEKKKKQTRGVRKSAYLLRPLAKETREKARERARERTKVKSNMLGCNGGGGVQYSKLRPCLDPDLNLLDSCTFNQLNKGTIDGNSSSLTDNWSPSLFIYQHFGVPLHEHQSNDFQILGNLWEDNY